MIVAKRPPRHHRLIETGGDAPPPERGNHGEIERFERTISDASGRAGRPYRFVDTLATMERRGTITAGMRQAGESFRDRFAIAQLDPLCAFDISRPRIGAKADLRAAEGPGLRVEHARKAVWQAILAVGGPPLRGDRAYGTFWAGNKR